MILRTLFSAVLLGLLAVARFTPSAVAQTYDPPTSTALDRLPAGGSPAQGVRNTGTHAQYTGSSSTAKRVQAMVWDNMVSGGRIDFSWLVNRLEPPASHTIRIQPTVSGAILSDPDVALALRGTVFYANIVYVQTVNGIARTYWDVYTWNNNTDTFTRKPGFPVPLGGTTRTHSSPNIDANSFGQVAIVWQEAAAESSTIRIVSPSIPLPGLTTTTTITTAESYLFSAYADGALMSACGSYRGISLAAAAANPAPALLFNQCLNPDVAMGEFGSIYATYINSLAIPSASPVKEDVSLVIKQFGLADNCQMNLIRSANWNQAQGASYGTPRIALRLDSDAEVQVALDWKQTVCEPGFGTRTYREIRNFGTNDLGQWKAGYTTVSRPYVVGVNTAEVTAPAISYYSFDSQDYYQIAWTAFNYPQNANARDIWARNLTAGTLVGNNYLRINSNALGNQQTVSISGRHNAQVFGCAFLFFDEALGRMSFKDAAYIAGTGPLARTTVAAQPTTPSPVVQTSLRPTFLPVTPAR